MILEAGDGIGGAWHWNTYPVVGVDIPSFSYQFSFDQRADWSRVSCPHANSYYFDRHGDVPLRPSTSVSAAIRSARFDLDDYRFLVNTGHLR